MVQNIINDDSLDDITIAQLRTMLIHFQDAMSVDEEEEEEMDESELRRQIL